jgi:transposase
MLKAKLHLPVSVRTIRRSLDDMDIHGRVARQYFALSPDHIRARLSFANGYQNWSIEQWMHLLFSDEKIFSLGTHGRVWVQRPPKTEWSSKFSTEKLNHPDAVNFWCCFSGQGLGAYEIFEERNTAAMMKTILDKHLMKSATIFTRQNPPQLWWFLWDNSPIHTATLIQHWLHNHGINCLPIPPYSPDLNPTEHLFADLARRVEQHFPQTKEQLKEAIKVEWANTDTTFLSRLTQSMPNRIKAIIENEGYATKY